MFKNFYIKDLFEVINNPQLDKENFTFSESAEYPYFTRTENNNGVLGYVEYLDEEHKITGNSLAVGMISMRFHYMYHDFYAGQFTKTLIPKFQGFNEKLAMYFMAILNKHSEYYQSFLVRNFKDRVSETIVSLPVIESPAPDHEYTVKDIDFEYMQERITELEQERITELEQERITELEQERITELEQERITEFDAYLVASGLDDYELTDEDKNILTLSPAFVSNEAGASGADCEDGRVVFRHSILATRSTTQMFKNFYLKDIFGDEPIRGTRLTKENRISGNIPLVTAGEQNEGIAEYISNSENQTLSNMLTIDMFGNCFYRDYLYKSDDNILSFGLDGKSTEEMLYIASIINSICKKQYSYVRQYRKGSYLETTIPLPINESSDPDHKYTPADIDWQYMQRYIRAIEKLAITDAMKYKDKLIETTRQIVGA